MSQIGLIPHAGEDYAGHVRKQVFQKMLRKPTQIIYIANDHHSQATEVMYSINETLTVPWMNTIDVKNDKNEHSYIWVIPEIEAYFKLDGSQVKSFLIGKKWLSRKNEIIKYFQGIIREGGIILFTADLTHFGDSYDFKGFQEPIMYNKYQKEETLILALIESNFHTVKQELSRFPELSFSKTNLKVLVSLTHYLKLKGRVVEYYDSSAKDKKGYRRYLIPLDKINTLVSYPGIIFLPKIKYQKVNRFDKDLALAFLRSSLEHNVSFMLPKWCIWYHKKNGIFVQTELSSNHQKTCCYGEYEKDGHTTADFLNSLSLRCRQDARKRWSFEMEGIDFDTMNYEIEVLQSEKNWKEYLASQVKLDKNSPYGVYLTFNRGSATYLPKVWKELIPEAETISDLLDSLAGKATGTGGNNKSWKNDKQAIVRLYTSKKYSSDSKMSSKSKKTKKKKKKKNKKKSKKEKK